MGPTIIDSVAEEDCVTDDSYDGIILGAGHNSLILQSYLGLAGFRTLCLERREVAGGGLATEELPAGSGFRHNTHSFFHRGITSMPWYRDLRLAEYGARYVQPELNVAMILRDGAALEWWTDIDRTLDSVAEFSSHDATCLRRWHRDFVPVVRDILQPEAQSPPLPPDARRNALLGTAEGRLLLATSEISPLEFVNRELENPVVRAGMLFFNGLREVDLQAKGFGHHIPALLASDGGAQLCLGGSAALAGALIASVRATGGDVMVDAQPAEILVENDRAVGVRTTTGRVIGTRHFVASSLNPQQTFLDLLDTRAIPDAWRARAASFQYNLLAPLFAINLNLTEPPEYIAAQSRPHLNSALMTIVGLDHIDQFEDIVRQHENGGIPRTVMWGSVPSQFDPTQAPDGRHTAFMWEKLPYRLNGDPANWNQATGAHARHMLDLWQQYAPNLESAVLATTARSPLDIASTFANMADGDLLVGAFAGRQVGYDRPFHGAGQYRTCIDGLYLCGSSSHPGGNITGLPGYNCAQILLGDLGAAMPCGRTCQPGTRFRSRR